MRWAFATDGSLAEKVFATFKSAYTSTTTATAATIARGAPVILATSSASNNGIFVTRPVTATDAGNNLVVGVAAQFPDTTTGQTGTWQAEDIGQVQIYGYHSAAVVQILTSAIAVGTQLIPNSINSGALITVGDHVTVSAATETASHVTVYGIGGHFHIVASVASSAATDTGTTAVFVRCM